MNAVPVAVSAVLIAWVWLPLMAHFHVRSVNESAQVVEQARVSPSDSVFKELRGLHSVAPFWPTDASAVQAANELLKGQTALADGRRLQLALALAPGELEKAPSESQLLLACMAPVQLLLQAYEANGNREYFLQAKDMVMAFDEWERHAWMPVGLWWNDHAVAARVQVLIDFWGLYRRDPSYNVQDGEKIVNMIARSGRRLSDKRFFTAATNHGVMQNISLLELSIALPSVSESENYRALAISRLDRQLGFYISDEGVILEHSAFYQHFGLRLVNVIARLVTLSGTPMPESWGGKFQKARTAYVELRRPDGTLPQYGDTYAVPANLSDVELGDAAPELARPGRAWELYPVSGYSVSWSGLRQWPDSGALSQMVVTWSNFPSHAHKHADDMSVLLWAGGQTWATNMGYWPYDSKERKESESWNSSNAPHIENEPFPAISPARLIGAGSQSGTVFLDLERIAPGGVTIRREVVETQPGVWVVIDASSGGSIAQIVTSWNLARNVTVASEGNGCYKLTGQVPESSMQQCVAAGSKLDAAWVRGSVKPFAGWQVVEESAQPANAFFVKQTSGSWALTAFRFEQEQTSQAPAPVMHEWAGPENWTMDLGGGYEFTRQGHSLRWAAPNHVVGNIEISDPPPDAASRKHEIEQAYFSAIREYPPFDDSYAKRWKISWLVTGLLLVTIIVLATVRGVLVRWYFAISAAAVLCWVCTAVVLAIRFNSVFVR